MGDSHGPLFPPYMDLQTLKSETDFSPLLQWKQLKLELLDNAVIQKKKSHAGSSVLHRSSTWGRIILVSAFGALFAKVWALAELFFKS